MHSKIFQISSTPIEQEDWMSQHDLLNDCNEFADYIGDEVTEQDDRDDLIDGLVNAMRGLLKRGSEPNTVVRGSDEDVKQFLADLTDAIQSEAAAIIADNVLEWPHLYNVSKLAEETHVRTTFRFYIEDWNNWAAPAIDLVDYIAYHTAEGDVLYVCGIVDYHY